MDQLKEIVRQAIKYRFWIAVGIAALLPGIAYWVGSDEVKKAAETKAAAIKSAANDVKTYTSGTLPNDQYKTILGEKNDEISKEVDTSWKKLYARQAPLLTWPPNVESRFREWGRVWPENVDPSHIRLTIIEYVNSYPDFVETVYQTFHPFDVVEGTGIVVAAPKETLLRPAVFRSEKAPNLGEVWAAQERLWIQRTLLDVIAKVNADAKDWDGAYVKQINELDVGSMMAQDQRSIAKGEAPEEAPSVDAPGTESADTGGGDAMVGDAMGGRFGGMMGGMGGMMGGGRGRPEVVYYIHTDSTQYKILPFKLSVLVDQNHLQDFLVALENSPMAVQVKDFEMQKPTSAVTKPEKGAGYNGMYAGFDDASFAGRMPFRGGGGGRGMIAFGGGYGGAGGGRGMSMDDLMFPGGGRGMAPQKQRQGGTDVRNKGTKEQREQAEKAFRDAQRVVLHDPYYNIVQVTVFGQARFYNPPPVEPAAEGENPPQPETQAPGAVAPEAAAKTENPAGTEPPAAAAAPDGAAAPAPANPPAAPEGATPAPANPPAAPEATPPASDKAPEVAPAAPAAPAPKPESAR